jgi:hypothetical protein
MIQNILTYAALSIALISCLIASIKFKYLSFELKIIFAFLLLSFFSDIISTIINLNGKSTFWWLNIYTILEFFVFGLFYAWLFRKSSKDSRILVVSSLILGIISIVFLTIFQGFSNRMDSISLAIEATLFIFISVGYFYVMLNKMEFDNTFYNPIFWINSGILIYFSGSFFSFMFSAVKYPKFGIWVIHNAVHVIFMLFILVGFWKVRKT